MIEAAGDPAFESWRNINAIDDVVKATFSMSNKLVVSALQVRPVGTTGTACRHYIQVDLFEIPLALPISHMGSHM